MALPILGEIAAELGRLPPYMLIMAAGSVLVLGLAGLAVLKMRRESGSARYAVWLLGFVGVLVLPGVSAVLPGWRVLPRAVTGGARLGEAPRPVEVLKELPVPVAPAPASTTAVEPSGKSEKIASTVDESRYSKQVGTGVKSIAAPRTKAEVARSPASGWFVRIRGVRWTVWVLLCWAVGSVLVLGRVLLGHLSLRSLEGRCTKVGGGELFELLEGLRGELGIGRRVELLSSAARTMPMTWGMWRARLLVPEEAAAWPEGQRRDVLLHELGHVKRWDCLTQCVSQVACAVYWFNPLAWVASGRMQVERERACDDLVLGRGTKAATYARHLLQSVSPVPWPRLAGPAVAMATSNTLEERMRAILDSNVSRRGLGVRGTLATVLLLMSALLPMAALKAQQAPPDNRGAAQEGAVGGGAVQGRAGGGVGMGLPTTRGGGLGGGRFGGRGGFGPAPVAPVLGEGPTCTFDATIYDVRVPVNEIGRLDVDALANSADAAETFEKSLAGLGTAKPMYRAHQSVRLGGDTIIISSQVPIVTSNTMTATGRMVSNYSYQSIGAHFMLAGKAGPGASVLDLSIQVSSTSDTTTTVGDGVTVPVMRNATMVHKGAFQPQKPFVVMSVDAGAVDKDGKAVAYIARVVVGEPQAGGK